MNTHSFALMIHLRVC